MTHIDPELADFQAELDEIVSNIRTANRRNTLTVRTVQYTFAAAVTVAAVVAIKNNHDSK